MSKSVKLHSTVLAAVACGGLVSLTGVIAQVDANDAFHIVAGSLEKARCSRVRKLAISKSIKAKIKMIKKTAIR